MSKLQLPTETPEGFIEVEVILDRKRNTTHLYTKLPEKFMEKLNGKGKHVSDLLSVRFDGSNTIGLMRLVGLKKRD